MGRHRARVKRVNAVARTYNSFPADGLCRGRAAF
jgi:hypothetical protein